MIEVSPEQIEDYLLDQQAKAISRKSSAAKRYKKSMWRKIITNGANFLLSLPGFRQFDRDSVHANLKVPLERWHAAVWDYPVNIFLLLDMDNSIVGVYQDLVLGDNWVFIVSENKRYICAELPIMMKKQNLFFERIDEQDLNDKIVILQAIKAREDDATRQECGDT